MDAFDFAVTELTHPSSQRQARPPTLLRRRLSVRERIVRAAALGGLLVVALLPLLAHLVVTPASARTLATWVGLPTPPRPSAISVKVGRNGVSWEV
jgi:hypothetical protein